MKPIYSLFYLNVLADAAPPLAPQNIVENILKKHGEFVGQKNLNNREVEDAIIHFGIKLAPWRMSFNEFENEHAKRRGEEFLRHILPEDLRGWFNGYKKHGGSWQDLMFGKGGMMRHLEPEDRLVLMQSLAKLKHSIRESARREVLGPMRKEYEARVMHHEDIANKAAEHLERLRKLAAEIEYSPEIQKEAFAAIREAELALAGINDLRAHHAPSIESHIQGRLDEQQAISSFFGAAE